MSVASRVFVSNDADSQTQLTCVWTAEAEAAARPLVWSASSCEWDVSAPAHTGGFSAEESASPAGDAAAVYHTQVHIRACEHDSQIARVLRVSPHTTAELLQQNTHHIVSYTAGMFGQTSSHEACA